MISNYDLIQRCKRYILDDPSKRDVDDLIKDALITANREIQNLGSEPHVWNREVYDEIFTRYYATISDITAANPGVITCDTNDPEDQYATGTVASDHATVMTDEDGRTLEDLGIEVGMTATNATDGSTGTITAVSTTTFTVGSLTGGTDNSWDDGDTWSVAGITDHMFQTGDIVYIDGVNAEDALHRLNNRLYRAVRVSPTTISLESLNGDTAIDTIDYPAYSSGGHIYHAGIVLPSAIEPSGGTGFDPNYEWDIKRVYDVQFDLHPSDPITEAAARAVSQPGSRPRKWRYQQYAYGTFASEEHLLFWYNYPGQRYSVSVHIEKEYPDLSKWNKSVYPPCPGHIHEYIWHRALANLAMHSEKQRRQAGAAGDNTKIEILNAQYWMSKMLEDEMSIFEYNRKLSGGKPYRSQSMSA